MGIINIQIENLIPDTDSGVTIIITDFNDWTEGVIKQYPSISTSVLLQQMHDEGLWAMEQKINEKTRKYSGMFSGQNGNTK